LNGPSNRGPLKTGAQDESATISVSKYLTLVLFYATIYESKLARVKDASHVTAAGGASAVPADGGSSLLFSGGSGISLPAL
jgi:hypothetical protein